MMPNDTQLLDMLENEGCVLTMWAGEDEGGWQVERCWYGLRGRELIVRGATGTSLRETLQLAYFKLIKPVEQHDDRVHAESFVIRMHVPDPRTAHLPRSTGYLQIWHGLQTGDRSPAFLNTLREAGVELPKQGD